MQALQQHNEQITERLGQIEKHASVDVSRKNSLQRVHSSRGITPSDSEFAQQEEQEHSGLPRSASINEVNEHPSGMYATNENVNIDSSAGDWSAMEHRLDSKIAQLLQRLSALEQEVAGLKQSSAEQINKVCVCFYFLSV